MTDKDKISALLGITDEEKMLVSRALELCKRGEGACRATQFLTPREQRLVYEAVRKSGAVSRLFFWGGYVGAVRRKAVFLPEWLDASSIEGGLFSPERERSFLSLLDSYGMVDIAGEFMATLSLCGSGYRNLTHRDYLGALMSLGIKRSVIGDICVEDNCARLFCDIVTADFIGSELTRAGRDAVKCSPVPVDISYVPTVHFEELSVTVASLRLDGVVRALLSVSRDDAASLVTRGDVEINYFTNKENDTAVLEKDIISVRGYGKYIIDSVGDLTRRGRIRVTARKYV